MQLYEVPAKQGYVWFRQGFWLFRKNPLTFLMLLFLYVFLVQVAVVIPLIGILAVLVFSPGIMLGFMRASRDVIRNQRVWPTVFLTGYRDHDTRTTRQLFALGGLYAAMVFLLSILMGSLVDLRPLVPVILEKQAPSADALHQLYTAVAVGGLLYTPIAMLMWFAPMLVAWHQVPPVKALFFSWIACWRNRGAFFTYLSIWAALLVAVPLLLESLLESLGLEQITSMIITPYSMGMLSVLYCSFYATWRGCFQTETTPQNE